MLDPLTALGAVANVTQFIEYAIKICTNSRNIYHSANGRLIEYDDLKTVTDDISILSRKLQDSLAVTATSASLTADEQALCDICKGCVDVSQELTSALERLKSQDKPGRFRSFRQALKSVWNKDDIDNLDKRVRMYKEELNVRIVVGLWTKTDVLAIQQSEGFASLDADIKIVIQSQTSINTEVQNSLERQNTALTVLHSHTETVIEAHAEQNKDEHEAIHNHITELSQQSNEQSDQVLDAQAITKAAVELSIDRNLAEHNKTREEMRRLKEQAERQVEVLTEEIRQLKIELEASVKSIVASMGTASKKEKQKLKDVSNAKFNLWVAKELILEKLKAFIAMFRFNFATDMWASTTDLKSWKLMPYPKPSEELNTDPSPASEVAASANEESMAYFHVDICYPISARNVPMVKMCLDQGAKVNEMLPGAINDRMTPLMKAVASAYEYTEFDTITTVLLMRRESRKMIQLLLEYGADPGQEDGSGRNARIIADRPPTDARYYGGRPDWLIQELLKPTPHDNLRRFLSMIDAVWVGKSDTLEAMIAEDPELCPLAEDCGVSPLGIAVFCGNERMVNIFLDNGTSPNALDPIGSSPLAIAVASGNVDMVHLLRKRGASLGIPDPILRLTPLEYSAREGNRVMCDALLMHWQDLVDVKGLLSKPLALAVRRYHTDVVVSLLDHGADVFMDMSKFLKHGERTSIRHVSGTDLTPRKFVLGKISSAGVDDKDFADTLNSSRLHKILEEYEVGARGTMQTGNENLMEEASEVELETSPTIRSGASSPSNLHDIVESEYQRKKERILALQTQLSALTDTPA